MSKKNQAAIDKVLAYLNSHAAARSNAMREALGLSKSELMGATRALRAEGRIVSEGATATLVWRLARDGETPPSTTRKTRTKTTKVRKGRKSPQQKRAATRTPRAPQAEASTARAETASPFDSIFAVGVTAERGLMVAGQPHGLRVFTPEQTLEIAAAVFAHFEVPPQ